MAAPWVDIGSGKVYSTKDMAMSNFQQLHIDIPTSRCDTTDVFSQHWRYAPAKLHVPTYSRYLFLIYRCFTHLRLRNRLRFPQFQNVQPVLNYSIRIWHCDRPQGSSLIKAIPDCFEWRAISYVIVDRFMSSNILSDSRPTCKFISSQYHRISPNVSTDDLNIVFLERKLRGHKDSFPHNIIVPLNVATSYFYILNISSSEKKCSTRNLSSVQKKRILTFSSAQIYLPSTALE
jgi:hypothetical protein